MILFASGKVFKTKMVNKNEVLHSLAAKVSGEDALAEPSLHNLEL